MYAIGIMSGTSLDGVDVCLVKIDNTFELIDYYLLPYEDEFKNKLRRNLTLDTARLDEICSLNFELGYKFKEAIDVIIKRNNLTYNDIEFCSSHGQTIWHSPTSSNGNIPSTLQIGEAQVISVLTGIKVISNFRVADVIACGQGAPLVPGFEYIYFRNKEKSIVLQNIGGIGNLTYLPKNCLIDEVIAFDTGPGNVIIDYFVSKYFNIPYDTSGNIASSGKVIKEILDYFKTIEFVYQKPPKSTGRELYSVENLERIEKELNFSNYNKADIITTISEYTVFSIVYNYKNFIKEYDTVIVSGGGSHNLYIMNRLKEELGNVLSLDEEMNKNKTLKNNFYSDGKEAFAFCVLGYLSLNSRNGNVKNATGAKYNVVLGQITLAKKGEKDEC